MPNVDHVNADNTASEDVKSTWNKSNHKMVIITQEIIEG
jgi:hypothetical protein